MKPKATMSPATMKPTVSPIAAQPTTFASYTSSVNSTINPALSVAVGVVNNILNEIPLPRWAVYTLSAAAVVLVLVVCICICCKCCCKSKKKKQQKNSKVNLKGLNANTTTALVQPNVTDVNRSAAQKPRGKLLYSLEYSAPRSELIVGIKQADNLLAMDMGGSSDPYVKVYILPDKSKTYESKVLRNTLKPVFNEKFNFLLPKSLLGMSSVVMQVFDFNRFSKHEMIGEIRLPLAEKDMNHVSEEWRDLSEPAVFEEENLGEICFSLRYVPVNSKLTVVILEAKNLKSMDIGGTSDPYVKVQLALDKRKWKKRKTSVKKKTLNPYYNESFTFNVSFDLIKRVNLILSVWDHDKMSRNDTMGKIFLGGDASGNQLRHWADMLSNPRRPVAQWHSLLTSEQVNSTITLKSKVPGKIRH